MGGDGSEILSPCRSHRRIQEFVMDGALIRPKFEAESQERGGVLGDQLGV